MSSDHILPPGKAERLRREKLEKLRADAQAAAQALDEVAAGKAAMDDLRRLATNRNGFLFLDIAYREQFEIVLRAVLAGLRDGIL